MSKARYEQGEPVKSIEEFASRNCMWFKWHGKTVHREVLASLQYRVLDNLIRHGHIYLAKEKEHDNVVAGGTEN